MLDWKKGLGDNTVRYVEGLKCSLSDTVDSDDYDISEIPSLKIAKENCCIGLVSNGRVQERLPRIIVAFLPIGCLAVKGGHEGMFLTSQLYQLEHWMDFNFIKHLYNMDGSFKQ